MGPRDLADMGVRFVKVPANLPLAQQGQFVVRYSRCRSVGLAGPSWHQPDCGADRDRSDGDRSARLRCPLRPGLPVLGAAPCRARKRYRPAPRNGLIRSLCGGRRHGRAAAIGAAFRHGRPLVAQCRDVAFPHAASGFLARLKCTSACRRRWAVAQEGDGSARPALNRPASLSLIRFLLDHFFLKAWRLLRRISDVILSECLGCRA